MEETWKFIKGYDDYQISDFGRVKSLKNKREFIMSNRNFGQYLGVTLYCGHGSKRKNFYIHRLVAEHFLDNKENKEQINHKDGQKNNNFASNLQWCTGSENIKHAYRIGLKEPPCAQTGKFGYEHHRSKAVYKLSLDGKIICDYGSISEAGRDVGVNHKTISNCLHRKNNMAVGYMWVFKEQYDCANVGRTKPAYYP